MSLNPFARQQALAASRAMRPEDSVSNVSGSSWGWNRVQYHEEDDDLPPPDLELPPRSEVDLDNKVKSEAAGASGPGSSSEKQAPDAAAQPSSLDQPADQPEAAAKKAPPPPPPMPCPGTASSAAPAMQAAQNFLAGVNPQWGSRKLRKQQERAARRGARALRFGQMGGVHNALSSKLPPYLRQVGSGEGERSVLVVDSRDQRISSPFQGWRLDDQCTGRSQHSVGCKIDQKPVYGISPLALLHEDPRGEEAHHCWIHDQLWLHSLWAMGQLHRRCDVP